MSKPQKVLILRFSSIGDIVLTTPVVRCVKEQLPGVELHYATKAAFEPILASNPHIDRLHLLGESLNELVTTLKKEKFDVILDLHNNLRTRIIKTRLGVKAHTFDKLNWEKWLLVNAKVDRMPNIHIVDRYMATAAPLGVKNDDKGLEYFIPEADEVEWDWLPETHRKGFVAYAIGANHNTKKLPLNRMIELCDRINKPVMLLGGKGDHETGEKIVNFFERGEGSATFEAGLLDLGKKTTIFNACGLFNINQSADLVRKANVIFTHDTGLMHIAAAFKKNVFSIWGNTVPKFGMYPYQTKFTVLENNKLDCRPCSKIGHEKCPKGHFNCMNKMVFDFWVP